MEAETALEEMEEAEEEEREVEEVRRSDSLSCRQELDPVKPSASLA